MEDIKLDVFGTTLSALRGGDTDGLACLCLHGWMDNAASFIPLQATLPELHLVALDLPGHGRSAHFPAGHHYHLIDQVAFVLGAADALGWDKFQLIGHSLGGCIAPFVALAATERVSSLLLLEALGPMTESAAELPNRIKNATHAMRTDNTRLKRIYASIDDAVVARMAATKMHADSARLIVERSLVETEGGYTWGFDNKIRIPSSNYLSEEQVIEVLSSVEQKTLCVLASDGYLLKREQSNSRLSALKNASVVEVNGEHHMHMDNPDSTASAIRQFLNL